MYCGPCVLASWRPMYTAWYNKVLRRRLHCSVKISDQVPISRKLRKPLWLTKAFLVNRCSLKIARCVYNWNFFYPLLWCEPLLLNIKNMSIKHVCSHNWGLRLNCYGLLGAKTFRDLRETGLRVVAKKIGLRQCPWLNCLLLSLEKR